jgi:FO synthase
VKLGDDGTIAMMRGGANDLGGTLMEENISRMAGSQHGVRLEPEQLVEAAQAAGRVAAQRTTLYEIVETYEPLTPAG